MVPCWLTGLDLCVVIRALFPVKCQHWTVIWIYSSYIRDLVIPGWRVSTPPLHHHDALWLRHVSHKNYELAIWNSLGWKKKIFLVLDVWFTDSCFSPSSAPIAISVQGLDCGSWSSVQKWDTFRADVLLNNVTNIQWVSKYNRPL